MYKIYAQIGFGTNRQTFNKNIATAEKSPIFTSHKSYTKPLCLTLKDHTTDYKQTEKRTKNANASQN